MNFGQRAEIRVSARRACPTAELRAPPGLSCRVEVFRCIRASALPVVVVPGRVAFVKDAAWSGFVFPRPTPG